MGKRATKGAVGLAAAASAAAFSVAFAGALWTGASTLLALAIHGLAALSSQLLMWRALARGGTIGGRSDGDPAAGALAFWSFAAAMLLFAMGAAVAIQNGVTQALQPRVITDLAVAYAALGATLLANLAISWRLMAQLATTGGAVATTVLNEARAGVAASAVALAGLVATQAFEAARADGVAAIMIGLILAFVCVVMAVSLRHSLAGSGGDDVATVTASTSVAGETGRSVAEDAAVPTMPGEGLDARHDARLGETPSSDTVSDRTASRPATAGHEQHRRRGKKKKRYRG